MDLTWSVRTPDLLRAACTVLNFLRVHGLAVRLASECGRRHAPDLLWIQIGREIITLRCVQDAALDEASNLSRRETEFGGSFRNRHEATCSSCGYEDRPAQRQAPCD